MSSTYIQGVPKQAVQSSCELLSFSQTAICPLQHETFYSNGRGGRAMVGLGICGDTQGQGQRNPQGDPDTQGQGQGGAPDTQG